MTMLTNSMILITLALAAGCDLDDGTKNACQLQTDCLAGYQCINQMCVGTGSNGGDAGTDGKTVVLVDAPPTPGSTFGTVEPLTPASARLVAANYQTLTAVTTAAGTLGCAVVGDLQASPGPNTAVVYAKVQKESGDTRCPDGVFAIVNDPDLCRQDFTGELRPGCAMYKRWNASGQQVAYQLAIGGYVSIQNTYINSNTERCVSEMSIQFAGGVTVTKTFQFDYNPLAPTSAFCVH